MKVSIDQNLCVATGMCTGLAPELFELDEDLLLHLHQDEPGEEFRAAVTQAVRNCPVSAIRVED